MIYEFRNHLSNKTATLIPVADLDFNDKLLANLLDVISEPEVKKLFHAYLKEASISSEGARAYLNYAKKSWLSKTNFVFFIQADDGIIIGSVDLQREAPDTASLGFWASRKHKGYMRNALDCLIQNINDFDYSVVNAYTHPQNFKAIRLLETLKFSLIGAVDDKALLKYSRIF